MVLKSRQFSELLTQETGESTTPLFPTAPEVVPKRVQILEARARIANLVAQSAFPDQDRISKPRW